MPLVECLELFMDLEAGEQELVREAFREHLYMDMLRAEMASQTNINFSITA